MAIQSETAIRQLATHYPYDAHDKDTESLRTNPDEIAGKLKDQVQNRLDVAGLHVVEARLSHLAYAPEIAQAMLRRQQAEAIIAARAKIVDGAVGMVEMALRSLEAQGVVKLDEERRPPWSTTSSSPSSRKRRCIPSSTRGRSIPEVT